MYMTARFILILALGAWLCGACQQSEAPSPIDPTALIEALQSDPDTEEYAVYSALINNNFKGDITQVLIMDQTRIVNPGLLEQHLGDFQENTPLAPELVNSFKERNQQPHPIEPALDIELDYQLLSQEELDAFRPTDEASGWQLLYEKYPQSTGFIYLSRVGFNADFSQALVYYEVYHYDQPLYGGYLLMSKQDGRWVVENGFEWMT